MRKRLSYSKKHPNMSVTELTKELSKKYGALSEHKKVTAMTISLLQGKRRHQLGL